MHMIRLHIQFHNLASRKTTDRLDTRFQRDFYRSRQNTETVFRNPNHMVLTVLYRVC